MSWWSEGPIPLAGDTSQGLFPVSRGQDIICYIKRKNLLSLLWIKKKKVIGYNLGSQINYSAGIPSLNVQVQPQAVCFGCERGTVSHLAFQLSVW